MIETIASRRQLIPDKYFPQIPSTYSQEMIDELRDMWVDYLNNQTQDDGD
ncbi:hypothetical protein BVRB_012420 isoform A [Beta vulgaris subsp. vulgaris]|uniref:Uncharacterized protein n=1 Tax=Beta vulgaris subsp. vulgaris TaxID=3555 RepID=A0A0J8B5E5_BETVV|nr:hypothetical protein BVRB_012420 isoform A [Beta vulgaris subsp. vulgaris]